ncbi:MAG: hypothetical protein Q8Q25_00445 [bacterium]|nr:hypothetical protein [bacterium]
MVRRFVHVSCLLFFLCFVGCIPERKHHKKNKHLTQTVKQQADVLSHVVFDDKELRLLERQSKKNTESISQQEAKFSDIPIPFYTYLKTQTREGHDIVLYYESDMSPAEIKRFYARQMEYLGWQQVASFSGMESLLHFKRSDRVCALSIRPKKRTTDLVIFVTNVL